MTRYQAARLAVLVGGEWADLSSAFMTERDIKIAETRQTIRDYPDQRRAPLSGPVQNCVIFGTAWTVSVVWLK